MGFHWKQDFVLAVGCQRARERTNSAAVMRVHLPLTVLLGISLSLWGCAQTPKTLRVLQTSDVHGYYGSPDGDGAHAGSGGKFCAFMKIR